MSQASVETVRAALGALRPDLLTGYDAALPGARAAVLARLWGALAREPIAGLGARTHAGGRLHVDLPGGRPASADAGAAEPYAAPPAGFAVRVDGRWHTDPDELLSALRLPGVPAATDRLAEELSNSVANLALARAAQPAPSGGPPALRAFAALDPAAALAAAEQTVVDGHPLHPACRTRLGMSAAEVLAYAPEHRPIVALEEIAVPAQRWLSTGEGLPPVLAVHPWQRDHVLTRHPGLRPTGRRIAARPLMSLRTLAPLDDPTRHLKTAVDVQMTSAVRTVSPAAVHNGPVLTGLLSRLTARTPGLSVLGEPAAGAVLVDGAACRSLAVVIRRVPRPATGEVVMPLAALAAASPADGRPLVLEAITSGYGGDPVAFFAALAGVLLPPVLTVLHAGVALEAHGQNTLVVLRAGRPVRLLYRDVGGVRVSPARLRAAGLQPPPVRGDLATDDPDVLRTKLAGALAVVLGELVAVLSRHAGADPGTLWAAAGAATRAAYDALPAAARGDRTALLERPLPVKATTAMRLAADPLVDLWASLPHPIGGPR